MAALFQKVLIPFSWSGLLSPLCPIPLEILEKKRKFRDLPFPLEFQYPPWGRMGFSGSPQDCIHC